MKHTRNLTTAVERLVPIVEEELGVVVTRDERSWEITVPGAEDHGLEPMRKDTKCTAAFLADLMVRRGLRERLEDVRWYGTVPSTGLSAWEEAALVALGGNVRD